MSDPAFVGLRTSNRPTKVYRIDLPCAKTGFSTPPFDVHLKLLPVLGQDVWTLLAHAAAGRADLLARWLGTHWGIENIAVASGLAPKLIRASVKEMPPAWRAVASFAKVHHLDLCADGTASWFIEGDPLEVQHLVGLLLVPGVPLAEAEVRWRPVQGSGTTVITRRQFEVLAAAVAFGYYEIPHRLDLRALAAHTGLSLGSLSELLRRAERAVMAHFVDAKLMDWPTADVPFAQVATLLRSDAAGPGPPPARRPGEAAR